MKGRRPTPPTLAIVRGKPGRRPLNTDEPSSRALKKIPPAPDFLSEEGKKAWRKKGRQLIAANLLTELDLDMLSTWCIWHSKKAAASRQLNKEEVTKISPHGGAYVNPLLNVISMCSKAMHQIEVEFGMSPASRGKVKALNPKQKSLFEALDDPDEGVG